MISKQKETFYRECANITCSLPYWQKYGLASGKGQILAVICVITKDICPTNSTHFPDTEKIISCCSQWISGLQGRFFLLWKN